MEVVESPVGLNQQVTNEGSTNKPLFLFLIVFTVCGIGVGGYMFYEYERIKRINATMVTPAQAREIIRRNSVS